MTNTELEIPAFLRRSPAQSQETTAMAKAEKKTEGTAAPGHNSGIATDQLKTLIGRIEKLEEEKKAIADDIKEVKGEAKGNGFDVAMINEMLRIRKLDSAERLEREGLRDVYLRALGMLADTPLGEAAMAANGSIGDQPSTAQVS